MPGNDDDFAKSIGAVPDDEDFAKSIGAVADEMPQDPSLKTRIIQAAKDFGQSPVGAAIRSAVQVPTAGFADEATAGLGALWDTGMAELGERGDINLPDAYQTRLDSIRRADKQAKTDSPIASGIGTGAGSVMTALAPGLGALGPTAEMSALGRMGAAGALGGTNALGNSEAKPVTHDQEGFHLDSDQLGELLKEVGIGAGSGAAFQGAADKAAPYLGRALKPVGEKLDDAAGWVGDKVDDLGGLFKGAGERQAFKAAVGNNAKVFDDAVNQGVVNQRGRDLLDDGIVSFGANARTIAKRAGEAKKTVGKSMDELFGKIDEAVPQGVVSGPGIAEKLRSYADDIGGTGNTALTDRIHAAADEIEKLGSMTMGVAQKQKNSWKFSPGDAVSVPKEVANRVKSIIGDEMETGVQTFASRAEPASAEGFGRVLQTGSGRSVMAPQSTGAVFKEAQSAEGALDPTKAQDLYSHLKQKYGTAASSAKSATTLANRQEKNRVFSLTDYMVGAGAGAATLNPIKGIAAASANKGLRERGPASSAVALDKIGDLVQSSPEAFGKFASTLQEAAKRGNHALAVTHFLLQQQDPEYRQQVGLDEP